MATWFTSDQHFYHQNILKYCPGRPFRTIEEMNEKLVLWYNELVKPDDIVIHLGDFSMAWRPVELYLHRLNGAKHLVMGNHDFCHPAHKKGRKNPEEWKQKYLDAGFHSVERESLIDLHGRQVLLNHMPYHGDHTEGDRHAQWRPKDTGLWLLHGHIHQHWKIQPEKRQINVGVDVWNMRPVSSQTLVDLIQSYTQL